MSINEEGTIIATKNETSTAMQTIAVWDFGNKEDMMALGTSRYAPKDPTTNPSLWQRNFLYNRVHWNFRIQMLFQK